MFVFPQAATDVTIYFRLRDSTSGLAQTGLLFNSAGASCYYTRPRAAATVITLATLASATVAHADGGFILVDDTNAKGLYRLDVPDAVVADGENFAVVSIEFNGIIEESAVILLSAEPSIVTGQVQTDGGNSTTQFKTDLASSVDDFYKDAWVMFRDGALASGSPKRCTAYTGATNIITVDAFTATPADNTKFLVINR